MMERQRWKQRTSPDPSIGYELGRIMSEHYLSKITGFWTAVRVIYGRGVVREMNAFLEEEMTQCHW